MSLRITDNVDKSARVLQQTAKLSSDVESGNMSQIETAGASQEKALQMLSASTSKVTDALIAEAEVSIDIMEHITQPELPSEELQASASVVSETQTKKRRFKFGKRKAKNKSEINTGQTTRSVMRQGRFVQSLAEVFTDIRKKKFIPGRGRAHNKEQEVTLRDSFKYTTATQVESDANTGKVYEPLVFKSPSVVSSASATTKKKKRFEFSRKKACDIEQAVAPQLKGIDKPSTSATVDVIETLPDDVITTLPEQPTTLVSLISELKTKARGFRFGKRKSEKCIPKIEVCDSAMQAFRLLEEEDTRSNQNSLVLDNLDHILLLDNVNREADISKIQNILQCQEGAASLFYGVLIREQDMLRRHNNIMLRERNIHKRQDVIQTNINYIFDFARTKFHDDDNRFNRLTKLCFGACGLFFMHVIYSVLAYDVDLF